MVFRPKEGETGHLKETAEPEEMGEKVSVPGGGQVRRNLAPRRRKPLSCEFSQKERAQKVSY